MSPAASSEMASLLKVLADATRLRIVAMLASSGEVCVCDLTEPLGVSQPTISHHMKVLREAGFVVSERRGKWIYHELVAAKFDEVRDALLVGKPQ